MQWLGRIAAVSLGHELARIGRTPTAIRRRGDGHRAVAATSPARTVTGVQERGVGPLVGWGGTSTALVLLQTAISALGHQTPICAVRLQRRTHRRG